VTGEVNLLDAPNFVWYAKEGQLKKVLAALAAGVDPNSLKDGYGQTALHWSADTGHAEMVRALLEHGADKGLTDTHGSTALHWAAANGHDEVVLALLKHGADKDLKDKDGKTALDYAVKEGYAECASLLMALDEAVSPINPETGEPNDPILRTPNFVRYAKEGDLNKMILALALGVDPNGPKDELHESASSRHPPVVSGEEAASEAYAYEVDQEFDPAHSGRMALHWAALEGNIEVVRLLLKHGADKDLRDKGGWTALHNASANGHVEVVDELLERGADKDFQDKDQRTALHWAAHRGHEEVVRNLLEHGANKDSKDCDGKTALFYAVAGGRTECAARLTPSRFCISC